MYGVIINGTHTDVSKTLQGAKNFATRNGYNTVSFRANGGYIAKEMHRKVSDKWLSLSNGKIRHNNKND